MSNYIKDKYDYKYMIIFKDSERNPIVKYGFQCNEGWHPLIIEMIDLIYDLDINKEIEIFQIKEKFGQFRIYYNNNILSNKHIDYIINTYTNEINNTCEQCGQPGHLDRSNGWVQTLCNVCKEK